jgi:hypothetical protein
MKTLLIVVLVVVAVWSVWGTAFPASAQELTVVDAQGITAMDTPHFPHPTIGFS